MLHILIVEDDELLRDGLQAQLKQASWRVSCARDGAQALAYLLETSFDGVILDLGLPPVEGQDMDGYAVLQRLRQHQAALPVLILTARDGVEDRVAGLNAGADDYLTKPFSMAELQARLQAMLRRAQLPAFTGSRELVVQGAGLQLRLDRDSPRAWLGEADFELTRREWALLMLLANDLNEVVSREAVLNAWGNEASDSGSNALEVYVHKLRRKLTDSGLHIRNVRGLGYMLQAQSKS
jgi:DNA-binding response OmpR family regulator